MPEKDLPMNNEIWYTSIDGSIVTPYKVEALPNISSNIYEDGMGIITCSSTIRSIGESAFENCNKLTSITISNSVINIEDSAFRNCNNLKSITCNAITPPQIGYDVFYSVSTNASVYVPNDSSHYYKSATGWKDFTNYIGI